MQQRPQQHSQQRQHRDHLKINVRVQDAVSGRNLGRLVDISMRGFCISGVEPVCGDSPAHLRFILPWTLAGQREVTVDAVLRWERGVSQRRHAGYQIRQCDKSAEAVLDALAARFSV